MDKQLILPRGIKQDSIDSRQGSEFAYDIHNMRVVTIDKNTQNSIINEKGNLLITLIEASTGVTTTTLNGYIIGQIIVNDGIVIFTTDPTNTSTPDYIYHIYRTGTQYYYNLIYNGNLNFSVEAPIEALDYYENTLSDRVYWVDGINQPRVLNIKDTYTKLTSQTIDTQFDFVPAPNAYTISVDIKPSLSSNGLFHSGIIQYVFTYINKSGIESYPIYYSPLYYCAQEDRAGDKDDICANSYTISISNPDLSQAYINVYRLFRSSIDLEPEVQLVFKSAIQKNNTSTNTRSITTGGQLTATTHNTSKLLEFTKDSYGIYYSSPIIASTNNSSLQTLNGYKVRGSNQTTSYNTNIYTNLYTQPGNISSSAVNFKDYNRLIFTKGGTDITYTSNTPIVSINTTAWDNAINSRTFKTNELLDNNDNISLVTIGNSYNTQLNALTINTSLFNLDFLLDYINSTSTSLSKSTLDLPFLINTINTTGNYIYGNVNTSSISQIQVLQPATKRSFTYKSTDSGSTKVDYTLNATPKVGYIINPQNVITKYKEYSGYKMPVAEEFSIKDQYTSEVITSSYKDYINSNSKGTIHLFDEMECYNYYYAAYNPPPNDQIKYLASKYRISFDLVYSPTGTDTSTSIIFKLKKYSYTTKNAAFPLNINTATVDSTSYIDLYNKDIFFNYKGCGVGTTLTPTKYLEKSYSNFWNLGGIFNTLSNSLYNNKAVVDYIYRDSNGTQYTMTNQSYSSYISYIRTYTPQVYYVTKLVINNSSNIELARIIRNSNGSYSFIKDNTSYITFYVDADLGYSTNTQSILAGYLTGDTNRIAASIITDKEYVTNYQLNIANTDSLYNKEGFSNGVSKYATKLIGYQIDNVGFKDQSLLNSLAKKITGQGVTVSNIYNYIDSGTVSSYIPEYTDTIKLLGGEPMAGLASKNSLKLSVKGTIDSDTLNYTISTIQDITCSYDPIGVQTKFNTDLYSIDLSSISNSAVSTKLKQEMFMPVPVEGGSTWYIQNEALCAITSRYPYEVYQNIYYKDTNSSVYYNYDSTGKYTNVTSSIPSLYYIDKAVNIIDATDTSNIASMLWESDASIDIVTTKYTYQDQTLVDTNTTGTTEDPTKLLFLQKNSIIPNTLDQKDGTLFVGNYNLNRPTITKDLADSFKYNSLIAIEWILQDITSDKIYTESPLYQYDNQLTYGSDKITMFKGGETYRIGVQLQYKTLEWSEPIYITDSINNCYPQGAITTEQVTKRPIFKITINDSDLLTKVTSLGYIGIRPVVVYPTLADRTVVCQGLVVPTVANIGDRLDNSPYAQPSWFARPQYYPWKLNESSNILDKLLTPYSSNNTDSNNYYQLMMEKSQGTLLENRHFYSLPSDTYPNCEVQGSFDSNLNNSNTNYISDYGDQIKTLGLHTATVTNQVVSTIPVGSFFPILLKIRLDATTQKQNGLYKPDSNTNIGELSVVVTTSQYTLSRYNLLTVLAGTDTTIRSTQIGGYLIQQQTTTINSVPYLYILISKASTSEVYATLINASGTLPDKSTNIYSVSLNSNNIYCNLYIRGTADITTPPADYTYYINVLAGNIEGTNIIQQYSSYVGVNTDDSYSTADSAVRFYPQATINNYSYGKVISLLAPYLVSVTNLGGTPVSYKYLYRIYYSYTNLTKDLSTNTNGLISTNFNSNNTSIINSHIVDKNIINLYSPDIEFDTQLQTSNLTDLKFRVIGIADAKGTYTDTNIVKDNLPYCEKLGGFYDRSFKIDYTNSLYSSVLGGQYGTGAQMISYPLWLDCLQLQRDDLAGDAGATSFGNFSSFPTYPWHREGSLNNCGKGKDPSLRRALYKTKQMSTLRYCYGTKYFNYTDTDDKQSYYLSIDYNNISNVVYYNYADTIKLEKLKNCDTGAGTDNYTAINYNYYNGIDKYLNIDNSNYAYPLKVCNAIIGSNISSTTQFIIDCLQQKKGLTGITNKIINHNNYNVAWSYLYENVTVVQSSTDKTTDYLYSTDPVRIKYQSGPHAVFSLGRTLTNQLVSEGVYRKDFNYNILPSLYYNGYNGESYNTIYDKFQWDKTTYAKTSTTYSYPIAYTSKGDHTSTGAYLDLTKIGYTPKSDSYYLIGELYRDTVQNRFGGDSYSAISRNQWSACGSIQRLTTTEGTILTPISLEGVEGDTFFQRYDHLNTYAKTTSDHNQVVDIISFQCEAHVNPSGRYDRNRGNTSNLTINSTNFNKYNNVYSQQNNFYTYNSLDYTLKYTDKFPTQAIYSLTKTMGESIDTWANINAQSSLDFDGDKGKITKLIKYGNDIWCFQDKGISQIRFNEQALVNTTAGVPVEIANSGKVNGKIYHPSILGCQNKWSIVSTSDSIIFIDNITNTIGALTNNGPVSLSDKLEMHSWINTKSIDTNIWKPSYFINSNDVFSNFKVSYDKVNSNIYFTTKQDSLCYSEQAGLFVGTFSYENTPFMINLDKDFVQFKYESTPKTSLWLWGQGQYNIIYNQYKPYWLEVVANKVPIEDKIYNTVEYRHDLFQEVTPTLYSNLSNITNYDNENTNGYDVTFNTLKATNQYQTGEALLSYKSPNGIIETVVSNAKKKFNIWKVIIPREGQTVDSYTYGANRIRGQWARLKLSKTEQDTYKMILRDIIVYNS